MVKYLAVFGIAMYSHFSFFFMPPPWQESFIMKKAHDYRNQIKRLVAISLFAALAYVAVVLFRIKIQFLTLDIKDVFITICAFAYGPLASLGVSLCVALIEMVSISDTMFYGFIMNALSSATFSCVAALVYRKLRHIKGAILSLGVASITLVATMLLANLFITPYYMGMPRSVIVEMLPSLILPFNALKAFTNTALILLLYKPISNAMKRAKLLETSHLGEKPPTKSQQKATTMFTIGLAALILVISLAVIFFVFHGSISFLNIAKS